MAFTNQTKHQSKHIVEEENLPIEKSEQEPYNYTVSIRLLIDAKVKVTGTVTGNEYVFPKAGSIIKVDIRDKDEILNKKRGRSCCGGVSGKAIFELVEEE